MTGQLALDYRRPSARFHPPLIDRVKAALRPEAFGLLQGTRYETTGTGVRVDLLGSGEARLAAFLLGRAGLRVTHCGPRMRPLGSSLIEVFDLQVEAELGEAGGERAS